MDIIFITTAFAVAYTFLRTSCEASISEAASAMVTGLILVSLVVINI